MRSPLLRRATIAVIFFSFCSTIFFGEEEKPIYLSPEIGHIMRDWNGAPTLFKERPAPVRMLFLVQKGGLDDKMWEKIFSYFNVSIRQDGKEADMKHFVVGRKTFMQESVSKEKFAVHVIEISANKDGWQEGYYIIGLGLDTGGLARDGLPKVNFLGQDKEIRLTCRTMKNEDDKLLRLRYEVFRHSNNEKYLPCDPDKAMEAVAELHKEFPGDCFGHASAGWLLEQQFDGRVPLKVTLEEQVRSLETALEHYQKVVDAIRKAFPQDPSHWLDMQEPGTVKPTEAFKKLRFDTWLGARGAQAVYEMMGTRIAMVESGIKQKREEVQKKKQQK